MAELTWGTPLFFDLWAAGMAGGAYFAAFLMHLLGLDRERRLLKLATYIGVPLVLLGVILIIADLGEPLRAFNMYLGLKPQTWALVPGVGAASLRLWPPHLSLFPISPMSLGGWVLILFTLAGIALIVLFLAESAKAWELQGAVGWGVDILKALRPITTLIAWAAFGLAILVMTYTGVVLATSSMPLWSSTLLLPALFVLSATCTGVGALIIMVRLVRGREAETTIVSLRRALMALLIIQGFVLVIYLIWLAVAGLVTPLLSGTLGIIFWLGAVLWGLIAPILLEIVGRRSAARMAILSSALVLLGGLILRAAIVVAGQV